MRMYLNPPEFTPFLLSLLSLHFFLCNLSPSLCVRYYFNRLISSLPFLCLLTDAGLWGLSRGGLAIQWINCTCSFVSFVTHCWNTRTITARRHCNMRVTEHQVWTEGGSTLIAFYNWQLLKFSQHKKVC